MAMFEEGKILSSRTSLDIMGYLLGVKMHLTKEVRKLKTSVETSVIIHKRRIEPHESMYCAILDLCTRYFHSSNLLMKAFVLDSLQGIWNTTT